MTQRLRQASFLDSAHNLSQLPEEDGFEVAFAGRSNAGKSSAINVITDVRALARTSKTPGRTQLIFFFSLPDGRRLVDLPGYGFARVPEKTRQHWRHVLPTFLDSREALRGLVVMMDCRHPLKELDLDMVDWGLAAGLPIHILLTKSDKLGRSRGQQALKQVRQHFRGRKVSAQLFSAHDFTGVDEARNKLVDWLYADREELE